MPISYVHKWVTYSEGITSSSRSIKICFISRFIKMMWFKATYIKNYAKFALTKIEITIRTVTKFNLIYLFVNIFFIPIK